MKGADDMIRTLKNFAAKFPDKVGAALYKEGQAIMTESKRRCPVAADGGTLRASGQVAKPVRSGNGISVTLSYGGAADAYAIAVHETPSEHDPPSWQAMYDDGGSIQWTSAGTGPKFLENPINEALSGIGERLGREIFRSDT